MNPNEQPILLTDLLGLTKTPGSRNATKVEREEIETMIRHVQATPFDLPEDPANNSAGFSEVEDQRIDHQDLTNPSLEARSRMASCNDGLPMTSGKMRLVSWLQVLFSAVACFGLAALTFQNWRLNHAQEENVPKLFLLNESMSATASISNEGNLQVVPSVLRTISYLESAFTINGPTSENIRVAIRNVTFPCRIKWKVNGQEEVRLVDSGDTTITVPSGKASISCEPRFQGSWFQVFSLVQNEKLLGSSLGPVVLDVKPLDVLVLHLEQPIPPANAALIRIKREPALVTLNDHGQIMMTRLSRQVSLQAMRYCPIRCCSGRK